MGLLCIRRCVRRLELGRGHLGGGDAQFLLRHRQQVHAHGVVIVDERTGGEVEHIDQFLPLGDLGQEVPG